MRIWDRCCNTSINYSFKPNNSSSNKHRHTATTALHYKEEHPMLIIMSNSLPLPSSPLHHYRHAVHVQSQCLHSSTPSPPLSILLPVLAHFHFRRARSQHPQPPKPSTGRPIMKSLSSRILRT